MKKLFTEEVFIRELDTCLVETFTTCSRAIIKFSWRSFITIKVYLKTFCFDSKVPLLSSLKRRTVDLRFRQQLHGLFVHEALRQLRREGVRYLYRGLLPPLIQKTSCRAVMFGMFEEYQRLLTCDPQQPGTSAMNLLNFRSCHMNAAFLGKMIVFVPKNFVKAGFYRPSFVVFIRVKKPLRRIQWRYLDTVVKEDSADSAIKQ